METFELKEAAMTPQLTVEQRAKVATEVTGDSYVVESWQPINAGVGSREMIVCKSTDKLASTHVTWCPGFRTDGGRLYPAHQRSQALALVEWLADKIDAAADGDYCWEQWLRVHHAINSKDIPALESLVWELMEDKE
jgi:hypothetical protein